MSIATNVKGVREIKYNVPQRLLKLQIKINNYSLYAKIGFIFLKINR